MITKEKLEIFDSYKGEISGPARFDNKMLRDDEWFLITDLHQDIDFINKELSVENSIEQFLLKLKENCDQNSYEMLASKISGYSDFQKVANIIGQIKSYITTETDVVWTRYDDAGQFLTDLDKDIRNIKNCRLSTLRKLNVEFGPTCTYQEISISNGWGDHYIQLSNEFDRLFKKITEENKVVESNSPKPKRAWWRRILHSK